MNRRIELRGTEAEKRLPFLEVVLIAVFMLYYLLPAVSESLSFVMMIGLGILYIAYVLLMRAPSQKAIGTIVKVLAVVLLISLYYYFFTVTLTVSAEVENYELKRFASKFQQMFFTALPLLFSYRVLTIATQKQKMALFVLAALLIVYVIIQSMGELSVNETASRVWGEFSEMSEQNVGTYNFVYAVAIALPAVFAVLLNAKHPAIKVLLAVFFGLGIVFLVMAQYTLSVIIAVGLSFLGIFLSAKKVLTKIIVLILCPVLFLLLPSILTFLAENVAGGSMQIRLLEIADYFTGESMGYNMSGRLTLYQGTLEAFRASPLIGASGLDFDGHATFLTVLADIGIIGGIPFYWLYLSTYKHIKLLVKERVVMRAFLLCLISVILTGFLNPIHAALPLPLMAWFIVPLMGSLLVESDERKQARKQERKEKREKKKKETRNGKLEN